MINRTHLYLAGLLIGLSTPALAVDTIELTIKDHRFDPAEITIPANTKVKLLIKNLDPTPEEFESHSMHREKIIPANGTAVIFIGPLKPGSYEFEGEFNPTTAKGHVIVQ